ncbi:MAG: YqeG family HAD IIIA-type phosphatase [Bacillota bacterium]
MMKEPLQKLYPHLYIDGIYDLPIEKLKQLGIRGLIFDIDNTIVPFDQEDAGEEFLQFAKKLQDDGFVLAILSNNNQKRVERFNEELQLHAVHKGGKPFPFKIRKIMETLDLTPKTTAMIGDQIFTDVWCGRSAGVFSILAKPMSDKDQLVTKIKRGMERIVIEKYIADKEKNSRNK